MKLPQPGDAVKTVAVLNERMGAATGVSTPGEIAWTGTLVISDRGLSGPGLDPLRRVYGDLFSVDEVIEEAGWLTLCEATGREIDDGYDPFSSCVALALQAMAFGVLMERLRWEREQ